MRFIASTDNEEILIDPPTVKKRLGLGAAAFAALLRQGLPRYQINQRVFRFKWSEIEAWLRDKHRGEEIR